MTKVLTCPRCHYAQARADCSCELRCSAPGCLGSDPGKLLLLDTRGRGRLYHGDDDTECGHGLDVTSYQQDPREPSVYAVSHGDPVICRDGRAINRIEFSDDAPGIIAGAGQLAYFNVRRGFR